MTQQYEFKSFGADGMGPEAVEFARYASDSAARSAAGRMSVRIDGPVDLARAGSADWNDRYMTTASPSEFHASGYRFERLES